MGNYVSDLAVFLGAVWRTLWLAVGLNPAALDVARASANPSAVVVAVAMIAGAMRLLGQSAVLFINRVTRLRFVVTIGVETLIYVVRLAIWGWVAWLCAGWLYAAQRPFGEAMAAVLLGSAPFVLGFLILVPYLGIFLAQGLRLWSFLVTVVMMQAVYAFALLPAVVCAGIGWIAVQILDELTGRLLLFWRDVVWKRYLSPTQLAKPLRRLRLD